MHIKKLNIADFFALIRILTFPLVLFFIFKEERTSAWLFIILFATDGLDGFFAHLFNKESKRRVKLDSWGDVAFLLTGIAGFYIFETAFFMAHAGWIFTVLGAYLLALYRYRQASNFLPYLAKVNEY